MYDREISQCLRTEPTGSVFLHLVSNSDRLTAVIAGGKILFTILIQSSSFMKRSVDGDEITCVRKFNSNECPKIKKNSL